MGENVLIKRAKCILPCFLWIFCVEWTQTPQRIIQTTAWLIAERISIFLSGIRATDIAVLFAITLIDNKCSSRCHPGESSAHLSRIFVSGTGGNKFLLLCFNFDGQTGRQAFISQWIPFCQHFRILALSQSSWNWVLVRISWTPAVGSHKGQFPKFHHTPLYWFTVGHTEKIQAYFCFTTKSSVCYTVGKCNKSELISLWNHVKVSYVENWTDAAFTAKIHQSTRK